MQVKKLEDEIGVKIFDRDKKPLQPTKIGIEILDRARQILRECQQLKEFVNNEKESLEGDIRIGIIPTLAPYLLPRFLPAFITDNPKVHLQIQEQQTNQLIAALRSGQIDIGLLVSPINEADIREITLFYEPFLLYLPENHKLFDKPLMLAEDLDPSEVLVLDEGHCFREQALAICNHEKSGSSIGFDYQSGSIEALKSLVKNGVGYTLVPELSVMNRYETKHIRRFSNPQPVREVSMLVHNSFIKERILHRLNESIVSCVPKRFLTKNNVLEVEWKKGEN